MVKRYGGSIYGQGESRGRIEEVKKQTDVPLHNCGQVMRDHPLYMTNPSTTKEVALVPGYAAHVSNSNVEHVMANPQWRSAYTSIVPDFIDGYYKNLHLHHLCNN
jgi:hypothetical protein